MNDVGRWLRDADPLASEPGLSEGGAARIRQAMLAASRDRRAAFFWPGLAMAAAVVAMFAVGVIVVDRRVERSGEAATPVTSAGDEGSERRQLQFATRGGTRVIWVFDPEFQQ